MKTQVVKYYCDGSLIEADFYRPDTINAGVRLPAIVLCHGFGGIRNSLLPIYATRFVTAGYLVLAFDFRGFGGSEGRKNRIIPLEQIEDIRTALTWLEGRDEVDPERLGVWGLSNGGAHVAYVAGVDARVKCAVGQGGYGMGWRLVMDHKSPEDREALLEELAEDRRQRLQTGETRAVSVTDIIASPHSKAFMIELLKSFPDANSRVTLQSVDAVLEYRPIDVVDRIAPRALMLIGCDHDDLCLVEGYKEMIDRAGEPKRWLTYPIGHYDIYKEEWVDEASAQAIAWFKLHL
jgi:pimeloyl-ACP methyl ester carboxylesterase